MQPLTDWTFSLDYEFVLYQDAVLSLLTYLGKQYNFINDIVIIDKTDESQLHFNDIENKFTSLDAQNLTRLSEPLTTDYLLTYTKNKFYKGRYLIKYIINATNNIAFYHIVNDNFIKLYSDRLSNLKEKSILNYLVNHTGLTIDIGYSNSKLFQPFFNLGVLTQSGFEITYPNDALIQVKGNELLQKTVEIDFSDMIQFNLTDIPLHTNAGTITALTGTTFNLFFYNNDGNSINHTGVGAELGFIRGDFHTLSSEAIRNGNKLWFAIMNRSSDHPFRIRNIKLSCIN